MRRLALALLVLAGCGGGGEGSAPAAWEPVRAEDGSVPVEGFEPGDDAARSPLALATAFLALDQVEANRITVDVQSRAEGATEAEATATVDGVLDDSVRAIRYVVVMERAGEEWRVRSAAWSQRCWPDRGHQDFSTELCL